MICEHLHDLYTLNSLSGWKGLKKFIPRDSLNSPLIYILFALHKSHHFKLLGFWYIATAKWIVQNKIKAWTEINFSLSIFLWVNCKKMCYEWIGDYYIALPKFDKIFFKNLVISHVLTFLLSTRKHHKR